MRKDSPVGKFPGHVILPDFLNSAQVMEFERVSTEMSELRKAGNVSRTQLDTLALPVILSIVQEWHVTGIDASPVAERFPLTPRLASATLIAWLLGEISRIYVGEIDVPNG